ncbi:transposase [Anoxybacillus gonensis]|uniref:IS200/IS605 family transposase n=2 Tax=Anoxybacillus TaxID=150247 RepID=A0AAW7THL9_9BACL|nr:IS200/IS605 family transposase [Anoxybacillus gonensis]AKS38144.1 transposase [Anoxybacillus gonensis]KGP60798.1 transposase [Anoxybacillus gonensis]MCX8046277.1 IS200/IS605 family transposase [Anoxybacillus gonensis]MDO0877186.1 IS200/IS605 family transposase [Anoxybacillus gonensis]
MAEVKRGRGYVYSIQYHVVWCVKYRHKVLVGDIDTRLKEILHQIAEEHGFAIVQMESDSDHIHLLIDCTPQHSIPNMIKALKGVSARLLFKEFPQLKEKLGGGNLWNPSYFVATVSEHTEAQIKQYIQNQKGR